MTEPQTAKPIGNRFVLVTADDLSGEQAQFHVSVAVGEPGELSAEELDVKASAGDQPLELTEGPPAGALPTVQTKGATAIAQYSFANPGAAGPLIVTVGLGGESAEFQLDSPAVA
jgi:hypothetical protein